MRMDKKKQKTTKQMERHLKGMANHYRIAILMLIDNEKGLMVEEMAKKLNANFKTISQHSRCLLQSGLIEKKYKGRAVQHALSPYGKFFVNFLKEFQNK